MTGHAPPEGPNRIDPDLVALRVAAIRDRIARAGGPEGLRIVAVTKTFGPDAVRAAVGCGLFDVGENYGRELLATAAAVVGAPVGRGSESESALRWHFLGGVQRREIPKIAPIVAVWEGVDRLEEGEAIARHAPGATVYVEVDASEIAGRAGLRPREAVELVGALRRLDLNVAGVMTIAPPNDPAGAARAFAAAAAVADECGLAERSMGMSDDLEIAVEFGSTAVRIGRGLFGARGAPARGATMDDEEG